MGLYSSGSSYCSIILEKWYYLLEILNRQLWVLLVQTVIAIKILSIEPKQQNCLCQSVTVVRKLGSSVLTAAHFLGKCQKSNARISKFIKFLKPKPHLFKSFNLVLIPSTIPLVVLDSKYPTISPNHLLIVSALF